MPVFMLKLLIFIASCVVVLFPQYVVFSYFVYGYLAILNFMVACTVCTIPKQYLKPSVWKINSINTFVVVSGVLVTLITSQVFWLVPTILLAIIYTIHMQRVKSL